MGTSFSEIREGLSDVTQPMLDEAIGLFEETDSETDKNRNDKTIEYSQPHSRPHSANQSKQKNVQTELEKLEDLEKKLNDIARQQPFRGQLKPRHEAHTLKNWATASWYALCLRNPADSVGFEQAVRFVVESHVQDEQILRIFDTLCWRHPLWLVSFPESLGKGLLMSKALRKIHESAFLSRAPGARGSIAKSAVMPDEKTDFVRKIVSWFEDAPDETRSEIALTLGEWGGEAETRVLKEWLNETVDPSESLKGDIIAALANIGGPIAVTTLLKTAETAPKLTALAAIGSLEFLASGGSTALTEAPEPPIIDNLELWNAYKALSDRLIEFSNSKVADEYVRYKAAELVDIIRPALQKRPAA